MIQILDILENIISTNESKSGVEMLDIVISEYLRSLRSFEDVKLHHYYIFKLMIDLGIRNLKPLSDVCYYFIKRKRSKIEYSGIRLIDSYIWIYNNIYVDLKIKSITLTNRLIDIVLKYSDDIESEMSRNSIFSEISEIYHDILYNPKTNKIETYINIIAKSKDIDTSKIPHLYDYRRYYRYSGIISSSKNKKIENLAIPHSSSPLLLWFYNALYIEFIKIYRILSDIDFTNYKTVDNLNILYAETVVKDTVFNIGMNDKILINEIEYMFSCENLC